MTTNTISPRWYVVDKTGMALLCEDEADARRNAEYSSRHWPNDAPHTAVQLAPVRAGDDQVRDALEWYASMAKRMGKAAINLDSQAMLTLMKEIAVDYGKRAEAALKGMP